MRQAKRVASSSEPLNCSLPKRQRLVGRMEVSVGQDYSITIKGLAEFLGGKKLKAVICKVNPNRPTIVLFVPSQKSSNELGNKKRMVFSVDTAGDKVTFKDQHLQKAINATVTTNPINGAHGRNSVGKLTVLPVEQSIEIWNTEKLNEYLSQVDPEKALEELFLAGSLFFSELKMLTPASFIFGNCRPVAEFFVFYGATWGEPRYCARHAVTSDFFQKSLAKGLCF